MVRTHLRELLPDGLAVAGVLAEQEVEGERRLRPVLHQAKLLHAAAHLDAVQVVAPREARDHALQRGRPHDGGMPLGLAEVREPVHADRPVGTGEIRGPLDGVVAVLVLSDEGDELSFRTVTSAHVLHDDDVAGLCGRHRVQDQAVRREVLAVGEACQEDRVLTPCGRPVDVGHQGRAVAHLGRHALLDKHPERSVHTPVPPQSNSARLESTRTPSQDLRHGTYPLICDRSFRYIYSGVHEIGATCRSHRLTAEYEFGKKREQSDKLKC